MQRLWALHGRATGTSQAWAQRGPPACDRGTCSCKPAPASARGTQPPAPTAANRRAAQAPHLLAIRDGQRTGVLSNLRRHLPAHVPRTREPQLLLCKGAAACAGSLLHARRAPACIRRLYHKLNSPSGT